jgi:hypothetical protein
MGEHQIEQGVNDRQMRAFTRALLNDLGLLVVEDGALVGVVTAQDFLVASAQLFEQHLTTPVEAKASA